MDKAESHLLAACNELLNTLREVPENRKCFDCSDTTSPRYVCTNFCTFVCSCCANIHKEFGHQIQCLSVFAFNFNEIVLLKDTGNKVAADKWLARWTPKEMEEPDPTSPTYKENARAYMRAKYVEKRWAKLLPRIAFPHNGMAGMSYQLHDEKLVPPALSATYHSANPFVYQYPPMAMASNRMSYPPQVGYHYYNNYAQMMAELNPYYQVSFGSYRDIDNPQVNQKTYINPFDDTPHTNKELLRARTSADLTRDRSNSFPPTDSSIMIRSASAQAVICPPDLIAESAKQMSTQSATQTASEKPGFEDSASIAKGKMLGLVNKMAGLINSAKRSPKMSV